MQRNDTLVWDWPVRACHWLLVVSIAGAWATHYAGLEWFDWHRRLGYVALVLVLFRIAWGFVGPRHARFGSFVRGPTTVVAYLRGTGEHYVGHNPLGALSVLAFLGVLLVQATTGLFANDEIANAGPFYGWVDQETSNRLASVHRFNSNLLLGLVVLHLVAVAAHEARRRGLVRAMLTGRKPGVAGESIDGSRGGLALALVAALAAALALAVRAAPEATFAYF
ncbi:MAG TPA: cytochrome b/b6 domain-containing protein [Steroidobacteraceae bacterium]|nr:cytochrome b/b6 domain-containing protein [Steroidobacteraceae bacterium]